MKPISSIKSFYLSTFANPASDRVIYRLVKKHRAASIIEIGLGNANRAANLIQIANRYKSSGLVRYTGIDLFESATDSKITLKSCHQRLSGPDVKLQLVPGPMFASVHRIANSHTRTDLLIISQGCEEAELEKSWFYFPRMLHAASLVMLQESNGSFRKLTRLEIERKIQKQPATQAKVA